MPFFSIIMPVYNTECYLKDSIESVLNQTFKNYELILVDDGSSDSSGIICDTYKESYPENIKVVHKDNGGQLSSRVYGLNLSTGKYICFIDSDDTIHKNMLQTIYEVITKNNADMIIFRFQRIDSKNNIIKDYSSPYFDEGFVDKSKLIKEIIHSSYLNSLCIKVCNYDLFDLNIDYSKYYEVRHGEDLIQSVSLFEKANRIYYSRKVLYNYRINQKSISNVYDPNRINDLNQTRILVYKLMKKLGYDTVENINEFISFYFLSLYDIISNSFRFYNSNIDSIFNEILSNNVVKKMEFYFERAQIKKYQKISLILFYKKKWLLLKMYLKLITKASTLKN